MNPSIRALVTQVCFRQHELDSLYVCRAAIHVAGSPTSYLGAEIAEHLSSRVDSSPNRQNLAVLAAPGCKSAQLA